MMVFENTPGTVTLDFDDEFMSAGRRHYLDIWIEAGGRYENIEMSVGEVRELIAHLNQALENL